MLLAIKTFLTERKTANLQEIAVHFCQQPKTVRCMLDHWVRKGKVCRLGKPPGCGSKCQMCKPQFAEVYRWMG